jgi:hypothetical protein
MTEPTYSPAVLLGLQLVEIADFKFELLFYMQGDSLKIGSVLLDKYPLSRAKSLSCWEEQLEYVFGVHCAAIENVDIEVAEVTTQYNIMVNGSLICISRSSIMGSKPTESVVRYNAVLNSVTVREKAAQVIVTQGLTPMSIQHVINAFPNTPAHDNETNFINMRFFQVFGKPPQQIDDIPVWIARPTNPNSLIIFREDQQDAVTVCSTDSYTVEADYELDDV